MANAKTHMNAHGGSTLRKATALNGNTGSGSQPIHEELCTYSADSISLVSLSGKEVSLSSRHTHFVDGWKWVCAGANEAANQFSAGKVTETEKPDAFVRGTTLP